MKNILVPCDFSDPAREAFKFAVKIASRGEGKIHVLYVIDITFLRGNPSLAYSYAFNLNFLKEMESDAENKFQKMWERDAPLTLPVTFKYHLGSLVTGVENYITEHAIDLVVMGTHGESNARWGSNTSKIIQHSKVPVLAIRSEPKQVKNIVVPLLPDQADSTFASN